MGRGRAVHAQEPARRAPGGRPPRGLGHRPCAQVGRALARLPGRLRPAHYGLQSVQSLVSARLLARHADGAGRGGLGGGERRLGLDPRARAPLGARGQRGAKAQAIGPSRGGQTTKTHVLADVLGRPAVIHLTPGNASDVKTAPAVIGAAPGRLKRLIADRGYDADQLRRDLKARGTTPVIPGTRSRKRPIRHDRRRYRERWRIEAAFCRLKDFRRVATRYDKLARNYASAIALTAVVAFWC